MSNKQLPQIHAAMLTILEITSKKNAAQLLLGNLAHDTWTEIIERDVKPLTDEQERLLLNIVFKPYPDELQNILDKGKPFLEANAELCQADPDNTFDALDVLNYADDKAKSFEHLSDVVFQRENYPLNPLAIWPIIELALLVNAVTYYIERLFEQMEGNDGD